MSRPALCTCTQLALPLCLVVLLGGCATPEPGAHTPTSQAEVDRLESEQRLAAAEQFMEQRRTLRLQLEDQTRLIQTHYRLSMANADLCEADIGPRTGAFIRSELDISTQLRPAARAELGLGPRLQVLVVADESPAQEAGLLPGDRLTSFNGQPIKTGTLGRDFERQLEKTLLADAPYEIQYTRDGVEHTTLLTPRTGCDYRIVVVEGQVPDAYADGRAIFVTTAMTRLTFSEDQLATVVAHQMAHNVESHAARRQGYAIGGMVLDMAAIMLLGINTGGSLSEATANALADDFESEADYLGSYMMARAGYDPETALKFWQILALTLPDIGVDTETYSHPFDAERLNALRKAEREIREKQEAGSPLIPEQKPRASASESVNERAQERDPFAE